MAAVVNMSSHAVWLDLDVLVLSDPAPFVNGQLTAAKGSQLIFARHQLSQSVSPCLIIARASISTPVLMGYAGWLRENPYLLDHQGWDQYLSNNNGDYAGLFDYKGRNTTTHDPDGPGHTFLAAAGLAPVGTQWSVLTEGFGSGDGWQGDPEAKDLVFFHFWGATQSQKDQGWEGLAFALSSQLILEVSQLLSGFCMTPPETFFIFPMFFTRLHSSISRTDTQAGHV